jgi:Fe-S-cluster containining protein
MASKVTGYTAGPAHIKRSRELEKPCFLCESFLYYKDIGVTMGNRRSGAGLPGTEKPWFYARGLCFSCLRCSACCRYESGYVFLSLADVRVLAGTLGMGYGEFMEVYCRWIPSGEGTERLSLKEKSNYDCIFWGSFPGRPQSEGCSVYESRPLQCRAYPFWRSVLGSKGSWRRLALDCPGMDKGAFHSGGEIQSWLEKQEHEPVVTRTGRRRKI